MIRWAPYPFLRYVFSLGAGITAYLYSGEKPAWASWLFAFLLLLFFTLYLLARQKKSDYLHNLTGLVGLLLLFLSGFLLTHFRTAQHEPHNLSHQTGPISHYTGVVDDYITQKPSSVSTTLRLQTIKKEGKWLPATGYVRLTLKRDTAATNFPFSYGTVLLIKGQPTAVKPPANPGQFDYRRYLSDRQIYHQHYLPAPQFIPIGYELGSAFMALCIRIRNNLDAQLRKYITSDREYAVATALLLGIKDYLPEDVKMAFANSGTMHVLAVSGLHVALLFWVFNLLLGAWSKRRGLKLIRYAVLISFFSLYAFVTALSASVLRAVLMFALLVTADTFRRQTNIYNTLAAAAFFLLLYNPYFLVDVGFQLSFLALLGIVYFTPQLESLYTPGTYATSFVWKLLCASVAAQLTTLPLTLYYFHQFPVYFLAANLVAITLSNIALIVGFLLLAFAWLPVVASFLGAIVGWLLWFLQQSNAWLLQAPFPTLKNIGLTGAQVWLLYALLALLVLFSVGRRLVYFAVFTSLMLVFSGLKLTEAVARNQQQFWVVYSVPKATALGFVNQQEAQVLADSAFYANPRQQQYIIQPHLQQLGLSTVHYDTLNQQNPLLQMPTLVLPDRNVLVQWQSIKILLCRYPLAAVTLQTVKPTYLVLSHHVYLPVKELAPNLSQVKVILDGSNGYRYQQRLEQELTKFNIIYYNINKTGALVTPVTFTKH